MNPAARIIADAILSRARREGDRAAAVAARGTITRVSPLRVDLHGADLELDDDDVELSQEVRRYHASEGLVAGDVLALMEVSEGEWIAVSVVSPQAVRVVPADD